MSKIQRLVHEARELLFNELIMVGKCIEMSRRSG
jgi:hypothetical protein